MLLGYSYMHVMYKVLARFVEHFSLISLYILFSSIKRSKTSDETRLSKDLIDIDSVHHLYVKADIEKCAHFWCAGKTTLLRRVSELYLQQSQHIPCYGFYTEEVRGQSGARIGFDIVTLDGKSRSPIARTSEYTNSSTWPRVGQYNVFVEEFERIALPLLTNIETPCLCFIDEIGKMELLSNRFKQLFQTLIDHRNVILLATIPIKPLAFVDQIRTRKDCHLVTVTRENRSGPKLQNELMEQLENLIKMMS